MSKLKLFLDNFLIYGVGGIISKIIPFIMIPIVTAMMPTTDLFGISDNVNVLISLCSSLAIMGMYDAMYRMFFEKEEKGFQKEICSTALWFTLFTSLVIAVLMAIFSRPLAQFLLDDSELFYLVYLAAIATLVGATNSIISAPTRMQNKRKVFLVMNILTPVLSYGVSIPLLLAGHYVIALPVAGVITSISSEIIFFILNREWFGLKSFKWSHLKPLLAIALPLLPNFLIYWVFNSSDKLMITHLIGMEANGVYSVGAKLGHASQLIYTAFAGGWQFFAFSTMKEKDQVKSNSLIFEYLGAISFGISAFVFALSFPLYRLLFKEAYWSGYVVAPYLFLAPLLQMLFQVACNQFIVVKKTWPNALILGGGAAINVILNLVLIPVLGIEGAAIATLAGYAVSDIVCVIVLCCMKLMVVSWRFIFTVLVTAGYIVVWRFFFMENAIVSCILSVALCVILVLLYLKDIKLLFKGLKKKKGDGEEQADETQETEDATETTTETMMDEVAQEVTAEEVIEKDSQEKEEA